MSLRSLRITNPWGSLQTIGRSVIKSFLPPPSPTPRRNRVMCVSSEIQKQFQGCFGTVSIKFCCQALLFHCIVKTSSLCYKSFSLSLTHTQIHNFFAMFIVIIMRCFYVICVKMSRQRRVPLRIYKFDWKLKKKASM